MFIVFFMVHDGIFTSLVGFVGQHPEKCRSRHFWFIYNYICRSQFRILLVGQDRWQISNRRGAGDV